MRHAILGVAIVAGLAAGCSEMPTSPSLTGGAKIAASGRATHDEYYAPGWYTITADDNSWGPLYGIEVGPGYGDPCNGYFMPLSATVVVLDGVHRCIDR